tara:strand:- start:1492 stop:1980 length:489 start_codon:yes stop_codon:yes gene_type:complete
MWAKLGFVCISLLLILSASKDEALSENSIVSENLNAAAPEASWDNALFDEFDVTCDGNPDAIAVSTADKTVWLGVVQNSNAQTSSATTIMRFSIGAESQNSFCARPLRIVSYPVVCEDEDIGVLPGCKPIKGCIAFSIADDECDSFNFYWNSEQNSLVWWRR